MEKYSVKDTITICSYTMQNHTFQVPDGNMPLVHCISCSSFLAEGTQTALLNKQSYI